MRSPSSARLQRCLTCASCRRPSSRTAEAVRRVRSSDAPVSGVRAPRHVPAFPDHERAREFDDRDLILVDTPGSSPSDLARLSKLETVTSAAHAKVQLVISATTRSEDITKIVSRFQRFSPTSVIFTKIDETDSKGPLAGDLLRNELPISYLTNGQRVPEDLLIPSADGLARYVLPVEPAI